MPLGSEVVVMDRAGAFLAVVSAILNSTALDFVPVTLFISCNSATPGVARLALSTGEETVVSLTIVVVRGVPFQRTTVELLTCAPTISTVVLPEPAAIVCGMI